MAEGVRDHAVAVSVERVANRQPDHRAGIKRTLKRRIDIVHVQLQDDPCPAQVPRRAEGNSLFQPRLVVGAPRGGPALTHPVSDLPQAVRDELPSIDAILGPQSRTYEWAARLNGVLLLRVRGEPAETASTALLHAAATGEDLQGFLGPTRADRWRDHLEAFVSGVRENIPYEELLQRADAAKGILRSGDGSQESGVGALDRLRRAQCR